jgi:putative membrane protein
MSKKNQTLATAAFAGLLALAPAFAWQNQGTTSGSGTQSGTTGSGSTQGTTTGSATQSGSMQLSSQDQTFVKNAAAGGMMEVELGRIAAQKASSADVKSFGQRMVTDHSKANTQLMEIASQKGVTVPKALPADMQKEMDKLSKLSGAEFDKMYMSHMLKDHHKDISEFEKEASKGADSSLKSFAQTTLPTLREHLQMAQSIGSKVGAKDDNSDHAAHGKSGS